MSLLQPGELADMRAEAFAAMDSECEILTKSGAALNSAGGQSLQKSSYKPIAGGPFKCRLSRPRNSPIDRSEGGSNQSATAFRLALPIGTPLTSDARVQLIGGSVYEVVAVDPDHTDAIQIIADVKLVG